MGFIGNIDLGNKSYAAGPFRTRQEGDPGLKHMTELVLEISGRKVYVYHRKPLTSEDLALLTKRCAMEVSNWDPD